jgi:hypothetical protein
MTRLNSILPTIAIGLLSNLANAQVPENPPPWWGIADDFTVSLYWDFNQSFQPGQPPAIPTTQVVPSWYNNPSPWTASANVEWFASLGSHVGVMGIMGQGTQLQGDADLFIDNDPHLDWVKEFWFQFDAFEGASGEITNAIEKSLSDYGRASVTEKSVSLGAGWERITISAKLIPQPDDETVGFSFLESALGTVAIDNLYVNSRCVEPLFDETGPPLGKVMTSGIDLTLATNGRTCSGAVVVKGPTTVQSKRYWVSALGLTSTSQHQVIELDATGVQTGTFTVLPSNAAQAPLGPMDMTVERRRVASGTFQELIYVIVDRRPVGGQIHIRALDANNNGALTPTQSTTLSNNTLLAPAQRLGLTFDPTGNGGVGSFWVSGREAAPPNAWKALEFSRAGLVLDEIDLPPNTRGLGYDHTVGYFYSFSANTILSPNGVPVEANGTEISGYSGLPTGVRFCGDLTIPSTLGGPGGKASGISVYRETLGVNSELRFVCVANTGSEQYLYELAGPYRYGYSRFGTCGMQSGPPFVGGSFDVTLSGVPNSVFAMLFFGTNDANIPLSSGIQPEEVGSIIPTASTQFLLPITEGEFSQQIPLPNASVLGYAETYFQWAVLDTTAPGFLGFSQAGKTVIYP